MLTRNGKTIGIYCLDEGDAGSWWEPCVGKFYAMDHHSQAFLTKNGLWWERVTPETLACFATRDELIEFAKQHCDPPPMSEEELAALAVEGW